MLGCTEDIRCLVGNDKHADYYEKSPFCRKLCSQCEVPVCYGCIKRMKTHNARSPSFDGGTIPMSLSNDHYYGHISKYIVENNVTWLECAASCTVWSTMLVYYLEAPYGNLINVPLGKPEARTQVKGNLFSFSMPWDDIEKYCRNHAQQRSSRLWQQRCELHGQGCSAIT